jgi:hypothetical protein
MIETKIFEIYFELRNFSKGGWAVEELENNNFYITSPRGKGYFSNDLKNSKNSGPEIYEEIQLKKYLEKITDYKYLTNNISKDFFQVIIPFINKPIHIYSMEEMAKN